MATATTTAAVAAFAMSPNPVRQIKRVHRPIAGGSALRAGGATTLYSRTTTFPPRSTPPSLPPSPPPSSPPPPEPRTVLAADNMPHMVDLSLRPLAPRRIVECFRSPFCRPGPAGALEYLDPLWVQLDWADALLVSGIISVAKQSHSCLHGSQSRHPLHRCLHGLLQRSLYCCLQKFRDDLFTFLHTDSNTLFCYDGKTGAVVPCIGAMKLKYNSFQRWRKHILAECRDSRVDISAYAIKDTRR